MHVNPDDLIPQLPKPRDLMPFPTVQSVTYSGHTSFVRTISVCPSGQWLASGSDDGTLRLWEVATGRCMKTLQVHGVVRGVAWNPNPALSLCAVVKDNVVLVINTGLGDRLVQSKTDDMLQVLAMSAPDDDQAQADDKKLPVTWTTATASEQVHGFRISVSHPKPVTQLSWHGRGDYLAVTCKDGGSMSVFIHQLSKRRSQVPFSKTKGAVQCVLFHPIRPFFFVAVRFCAFASFDGRVWPLQCSVMVCAPCKGVNFYLKSLPQFKILFRLSYLMKFWLLWYWCYLDIE